MEAALSLGSNRGNRLGHLRRAVRRLAALPGARIVARSRVYETEPVDVKPEYRPLEYLNTVIIIESTMLLFTLIPAYSAACRLKPTALS